MIIDAIARSTPATSRDAEFTIERVLGQLSHNNAAVALSTVRLVVKYLECITDPESIELLQAKIGPPLVTMLAAEPEVQYVALRNMRLITQKRPSVLMDHVEMFFVKYNDPVYVKQEKLELIGALSSDRNVEKVLLELREYASEVDMPFVRTAIRQIGRLAIKVEVEEKIGEQNFRVLSEMRGINLYIDPKN